MVLLNEKNPKKIEGDYWFMPFCLNNAQIIFKASKEELQALATLEKPLIRLKPKSIFTEFFSQSFVTCVLPYEPLLVLLTKFLEEYSGLYLLPLKEEKIRLGLCYFIVQESSPVLISVGKNSLILQHRFEAAKDISYATMKEFEKAQDYALKAVDIDQTHSQALTVLGDIAFRNNDYKLAENYYKKAASKDETTNAEIKLAKTYQKLNNNKKAKEIYSRILRVSSNAYEAYYQIALLEKDRELTYLKKALAINPDFKDGWIDLARFEISKEDYEKALSFLNIAKYIDENDFRYYYYQGLMYKAKGLSEDAKYYFQKSLTINTNNNVEKMELGI